MTMPARYDGPAFMAELEATGGDFTRLSNTVAARDGALPVAALLADLRSAVLHAWQPPGGGEEGALMHCVIHALDIVEAVPLDATRARRRASSRCSGSWRRRGGAAEPVRGRSQRRGAAGGRPGVVLGLRCAGHGAGAGAGPGGLRPPAAAGPPGRRGGAAASAGRKRLGQLAGQQVRRRRAGRHRSACSTGTGRPANPVSQGVAPLAGKRAMPTRTSQMVSTTPRFAPGVRRRRGAAGGRRGSRARARAARRTSGRWCAAGAEADVDRDEDGRQRIAGEPPAGRGPCVRRGRSAPGLPAAPGLVATGQVGGPAKPSWRSESAARLEA